ncbi:DUF4097 family beta strand repeat-containing protein [Microbacterium pseudoresistens]|uniref:DUF4097 domain-containing protein n=1 Tax=Microbacterium pseudoresistens TaxID=640634 RepID=A0A7Y9EU18_9MICO|nr:DUF4097 family beta strand repeat-containing protein [Microbacterium pseudoresistens]NYD53794.1 hypothetical protein [Microbacterium pseudoresistens]
MTEKWLIAPGEERVIDIDQASRLKIGLVGGQVDVIAHDEPGIRIEVHGVTVKDLRIQSDGTQVEIDHPQLGWDNFLEVFRNFGSGGPKAEVSVAVPRHIALTLGVVSAGALVSGLTNDARLNTVSGDVIVDTHTGDLSLNAVSGDVQVRGLAGSATANSVSGDVAITGTLRKTIVDTVSGSILVDAEGAVNTITLNTVSGASTIRLDDGLPANYVTRSMSGRLTIDGIDRGGSGPSNYAGRVGELAGSFADVRVNSVSGAITVLRRPHPSVADDPVSFDGDEATAAEGDDRL